MTTLYFHQKVRTPNGDGIFQGWMHSDGDKYPLVSHIASADIDPEKCRATYHVPGGSWWYCGYDTEKVEAI
jgi:hypothetical protein